MITFDPKVWTNIKAGIYLPAASGQIKIKSEQQSVVWVKNGENEAIAAVGHECDLRVAEGSQFKVVTKGAVCVLDRAREFVAYESPVYTNVDRMPHESGNYDEVTRALRKMQFEHRAMMDEIRATQNFTVESEENTEPAELVEDVEDVSNVDGDSDSSAEDESLASEG